MKYVARVILCILLIPLLPMLIAISILGVLLELRKDKPDWKTAFDFPLWIITGK